ncbi:hypothetical protein [Paraburkholderia terrae]|uniref:hypothetical protein n=1 Tax=Paraburkholderia terrae TaxID=311230 RepID=UPI00204CE210|nr:hypothetical protein [Paraburkholderia terrae]BDC46027.1 hypothetical protein PTKU15_93240 [Paraburkholderia terrae]
MPELSRGLYRITGIANLRHTRVSTGEYHVLQVLPIDALVYSVGGGPHGHASYFDGNAKAGTAEGEFKVGGWRNDHTWVLALSTLELDGTVSEGWVENGKMAPAQHDVDREFFVGDVLYGRSEAREPWTGRLTGRDLGSNIAGSRYNIIDDLNNAILNTKVWDEDVQSFADWLSEEKQCKATSIRIRQMCKCGLTYITSVQQSTVHFMLDGLDAGRVVREAGVLTKLGVQDMGATHTQKHCTGAEMRRLMRQRMFNARLQGGKNYAIELKRVMFYLASARVPAPWESGAPGAWPTAWREYSSYKSQNRLGS